MDSKTKRTICLVVGIASILTIVGTISYAYFTATGETRPVQATINTATVSVRFADNDNGITSELNFGEYITKRFMIENTGTVDAKVRLFWDKLVNTYTEGSLTYTLSYSETENGTYSEIVGNTNVPRSKIPTKATLANSITIPVGKTYYYELKVTLNYLKDVNQDPDLDAVFYTDFGAEDINVKSVVDKIIASSNGVRTDFDSPATSDEGVFEMADDYGTSYYFRGAVENNYVQFASFYWRIIRINGDGSLRILYDGTTPHANCESSDDRYTKINQVYNSLANDAKYGGWMYGPANTVAGTTTPSTSKEEAQSNIVDSDIKKVVDAWYKTNIEDKGYGQYVSDASFCNDRSTPGRAVTGYSSDTGLGYGVKATVYGGMARGAAWSSTTNPQLKCPQKNDAFTVEDTTKGNGALTYPIGLITADEIMIAGSGKARTINNNYYLHKSSNHFTWSFSPAVVPEVAKVASVILIGNITDNSTAFHSTHVNHNDGAIAPVINLTAEYVSNMIGDGTIGNEYRVE